MELHLPMHLMFLVVFAVSIFGYYKSAKKKANCETTINEKRKDKRMFIIAMSIFTAMYITVLIIAYLI